MTDTTAARQNAALDALAVLLALNNGNALAVDAMFATYTPGTEEFGHFVCAITAHALCAVRLAACQSGITPEKLLAGIAASIRGDVTNEIA